MSEFFRNEWDLRNGVDKHLGFNRIRIVSPSTSMKPCKENDP